MERCADTGILRHEAGLSLTLPDSSLPRTIMSSAGKCFRAMPTNGDGACGIHSVFGRMLQGELYLPNARHFLRTQFGVTIEGFRRGVDSTTLCEAVEQDP